ncbi:catechol O-methyltransferase [Astyanax mexicanus]|uniref:catechol O-methyltransferase n=1 Tax=Astyanax mexicanus TaxID=7994 RepID=UPI0020CAEEDB|nr:catechol O-methyltransferase [Astyanax mexicanus]
MVSLLLISLPLLPVVFVATTLCHSRLLAICHRVCTRLQKLFHGKVCVKNTHAYVFSNCTHGQAASVLETFNLYARTHASVSIGPEKGEFLDEIVRREAPLRVLELGMHCGYTSVRILRLLPPSGKLLTVELDPITAEKGEEIILVSGFKTPQFQVQTCSSAEAIASLPSQLGESCLDLVMMDHDPEQYLPDLLALQRGKLLSARCVLLLNRTQEPGAQALLKYVSARPQQYNIEQQFLDMVEIHCCVTIHPQGEKS